MRQPRWEPVVQGERRASGDETIVFSTVLGSCVAACLFDAVAGVGGMNHFLLPGETEAERGGDVVYGAHLMELLVNDLMQMGAQRPRLAAKLFGGARILAGLTDIGRKNADFAQRYLAYEGIRVVSADVGGVQARRLQFWPVGGRARVRYSAQEDARLQERRPAAAPCGAVELF